MLNCHAFQFSETLKLGRGGGVSDNLTAACRSLWSWTKRLPPD